MNRSDFKKGLIADMYEWYLDAKDKLYKEYSPIYPKIADVRDVKEITGSYAQGTTVIADSGDVPFRDENSPIKFENEAEGYTWHASIKSIDIGKRVSMELNRDIEHRAKDFLRKFVVEGNLARRMEIIKERLVAKVFNEGALLAGSDIFDQNIPGVLTTTYGKFCYDGKPFFNMSDNLRSSKGGGTYYNGLDLALSYDNLKTAYTLLTSTNAKMENDEPFDNTQNIVLLVPPALKLTADVLINSTLVPGGANNDKNPLQGAAEIVEQPYFTQTDCWALVRKGLAIRVYFASKPVFDFWEVKETRELRASAHLDVAVTVTNWRGAVGSKFPTA
jgi:hypothetical protein